MLESELSDCWIQIYYREKTLVASKYCQTVNCRSIEVSDCETTVYVWMHVCLFVCLFVIYIYIYIYIYM